MTTSREFRASVICGVMVLAPLFLLMSASAADKEERMPRAVPQAVCGQHDRPETVQGQTTLAERFSPGPAKAFNCNLDLIGQLEGEGAGFDLDVLGHCAYVPIAYTPRTRHPGVAVVDITDPRHLNVSTYLTSPAMLYAAESIDVNAARGLLFASKTPTTAAEPIDLYDISRDCLRPVFKSSSIIPRMMSHAGKFVPDGKTFYGTSWDIFSPPDKPIEASLPPLSGVFAMDTSDPKKPHAIATWIPPKDWMTHSVNVNAQGTRAYVALSWRAWGPDSVPTPHGLVILDVSDIQYRRENPNFRVVSTLFWDDSHEAQFIVPVTIHGNPLLIFSDLMGTIGYDRPARPEACRSGKPGHGFPRIIDISDEKKPSTVSKIMLEVSLPQNCEKVLHDPSGQYGYGSLACDVDNPTDTRLLACAYFEAGLRVFDIRNPAKPVEVAYYKPPAMRSAVRPGSLLRSWAPVRDYTADQVLVPKFLPNRDIAFVSSDNGLQIVRFSSQFKNARRELFVR